MENREGRGRTASDRRVGVRRGASLDTAEGRTVRGQSAGEKVQRAAPGVRPTKEESMKRIRAARESGTGRTRVSGDNSAGRIRRPGEDSAERIRRAEEDGTGRTRIPGQSDAGRTRVKEGLDEDRGVQIRRRRPQSAGPQSRGSSERPQQRRQPSGSAGDRRTVRGAQSKKRRKKNLGIRIAFLILLIIMAAAAVFLWKRYSPSREEADRNKYYGIENENQLAIIVDNQIVEPHGMIADGKAYIQYEIVRDYINSRFYWDANENILLYTLPNDMVSVGVGSKEYTVSKEKNTQDYVILKTEGSTAYIALDFIQQYSNIDYEVYDNPGRVMIVSDWGETTVAEVKKNTQVRYRGGVKSPILAEVKKKDEVTVVEHEGDWEKVRTKDGFIGYIKGSALKEAEKKTISREFEEPEYTNIKKDYTINMAWHNVTNTTANDSVLQRIAESKGLTTIAPTWFHVEDVEGNIDSIASSSYVNYAHQSNIEVWAAIRDFDGGIGSYEESFELLSRTSRRENLINKLIAEALQVGVDGINVDFEKISDECGEHYIQFIRELSIRCRQNGLVLSVDNYVPKGFNMQYNRKEQGIVADYVIIMGYDEHYGGSPEAGPVSSYNFVKEGIEETLKEVPAEKVISGIPFFTRLWAETPKTEQELAEQAGTDAAEYAMNVSSEPFGMSSAKAQVSDAGAEVTWDDTAQQNFATWSSDGTTYKIWLEDAASIEPKLKLMKDNHLAGTAAWAIGQEDSEIWELILKYTN